MAPERYGKHRYYDQGLEGKVPPAEEPPLSPDEILEKAVRSALPGDPEPLRDLLIQKQWKDLTEEALQKRRPQGPAECLFLLHSTKKRADEIFERVKRWENRQRGPGDAAEPDIESDRA